MFCFEPNLTVWLHREPVDFRKSINGLAALVQQAMQLDPLAGSIFAFTNRRRDRIKLLLWDRNGFWLLDGINIEEMRRHRSRPYQHAC